MTQKIGSVPQWYLGADCLATDSVVYPRSIVGWDGKDLTAEMVGDSFYGVLMNKDKTKMELVQIDPSGLATYNTTGLTFLKRGLPLFVDGSDADFVEVAANKLNWAVGDILLVGSHPPVLFRLAMKFLNGGEFDANYSFTGKVTFSSADYPEIDNANISPLDDEDIATKKYVDDVASGTGINYNRIVVEGNAGDTISAGNIVYFDETDKEWKLASASATETSEDVLLGIAQGIGTDGSPIAGGVLIEGMDSNQNEMTIGALVYLSDTAGEISATPGTKQVELGYAHSETRLLFKPVFKGFVSKDIKDALAGSAGTPSATNKYITADDVVEANTASKIVRRDSNGDVLVAATPTNANAATPKNWVESQLPSIDETLGVSPGESVKTYHNFQVPFIFSTNVPTGDFWIKSGYEFTKTPINYVSLGADYGGYFITSSPISVFHTFATTKTIMCEWEAQYATGGNATPSSIGIASGYAATLDYDDQTEDAVSFVTNNGTLYAHTANAGVGHTETQINGITLTNRNTFKIEFLSGSYAKFYINGSLVATNTTNLPDASDIYWHFGASTNSASVQPSIITAPFFSIEK